VLKQVVGDLFPSHYNCANVQSGTQRRRTGCYICLDCSLDGALVHSPRYDVAERVVDLVGVGAELNHGGCSARISRCPESASPRIAPWAVGDHGHRSTGRTDGGGYSRCNGDGDRVND